jgi:chemotaxis protein methyltransferase WspC
MRSAGIAPENFTIDAVDVSQQAVHRAQRGIYKRNAFRGNEPSFRDRYFAQGSDGFELSPEIRKLVQFRCGNLLTLERHNGMAYDIIFCRNLLIYFDQATQAAAIRKLSSLLHDDGLLFCGYAEVPSFCHDDFTRVPFPNAFAVKKKKNVSRGAPLLATPPVPMRVRPRGRDDQATPPKPLSHAAPSPPETTAKQRNPDALLERANRLADQGTIDDASEAFRAYLDLVPDSAHAHFMLGLLSEQRHDDKTAEVFLRRAVYLEPNHYDALCHLALLAERRGHDGTARSYRNRAARVFERRSQGLDR